MIRLNYNESDIDDFRRCHQNYRNYLASIKSITPPSAFAFAAAAWHYDHMDRRCPHDSSIVSVEMRYAGAEDGPELLNMVVRLEGAWHEDTMLLTYKNVEYYDFRKFAPTGLVARIYKRPHSQHGDWLIDEIHLSPTGRVIHEIEFELARWIIHCEDIEYLWVPKGSEDDSPKTQYQY